MKRRTFLKMAGMSGLSVAAGCTRPEEIEVKKRGLDTRQKALEARITALQAEIEAEKSDLQKLMNQENERQRRLAGECKAMDLVRRADALSDEASARKKPRRKSGKGV